MVSAGYIEKLANPLTKPEGTEMIISSSLLIVAVNLLVEYIINRPPENSL